jgi:hypothetical protein
MSLIPIDIVNSICKLAAQHDKLWYPVFDLKTGRLSWKINKFCKKSKEETFKIYHSHFKSLLSEGQLRLVIYQPDHYENITLRTNYKSISSIKYGEKNLISMYISFVQIINNKAKTCRATLKFFRNKHDRIIFLEKEKNTDLAETYLYADNDVYAVVKHAAHINQHVTHSSQYLNLCIYLC